MEVAVWSVATVAATNTAICGDIRDISSRRVSGSVIVASPRACRLHRSCSVAVSRMCCPMLNSHLVMRCFARRIVRKHRRRDDESCSRKCDDYFLHLVSLPEPRAVPICFHGPWNNHPKPLPLFRVSVSAQPEKRIGEFGKPGKRQFSSYDPTQVTFFARCRDFPHPYNR